MVDLISGCKPENNLHIWEIFFVIFYDRNENDSFLVSMIAKKFFQFLEILAVPDTHSRLSIHGFSLVPLLVVSARY